MLKELIILAVSVLVAAAVSGLVLVWIVRPVLAKLLKRPVSLGRAYLSLVLIDVLGHLANIVLFMLLGRYTPAVSNQAETWLGNIVFLIILGTLVAGRAFGLKPTAGQAVKASFAAASAVLIRDGILLTALAPYLAV